MIRRRIIRDVFCVASFRGAFVFWLRGCCRNVRRWDGIGFIGRVGEIWGLCRAWVLGAGCYDRVEGTFFIARFCAFIGDIFIFLFSSLGYG